MFGVNKALLYIYILHKIITHTKDLDTGVQVSHPKPRLWLNLDIKSTHALCLVLQITADFFCIKPDHDLSLTLNQVSVSQRRHNKFNNAAVTMIIFLKNK